MSGSPPGPSASGPPPRGGGGGGIRGMLCRPRPGRSGGLRGEPAVLPLLRFACGAVVHTSVVWRCGRPQQIVFPVSPIYDSISIAPRCTDILPDTHLIEDGLRARVQFDVAAPQRRLVPALHRLLLSLLRGQINEGLSQGPALFVAKDDHALRREPGSACSDG